MANEDELINKVDIRRIAEEGTNIYVKIKDKYDPDESGKFLAIDIDTAETFLGDSSSAALILAKEKYPGKVFYVVKIGFDSAETMAASIFEDYKR